MHASDHAGADDGDPEPVPGSVVAVPLGVHRR
jgi:hypothetical protein